MKFRNFKLLVQFFVIFILLLSLSFTLSAIFNYSRKKSSYFNEAKILDYEPTWQGQYNATKQSYISEKKGDNYQLVTGFQKDEHENQGRYKKVVLSTSSGSSTKQTTGQNETYSTTLNSFVDEEKKSNNYFFANEFQEKEDNNQENKKNDMEDISLVTKTETNMITQLKLHHYQSRRKSFVTRKKLVLLYTSLFGNTPWRELENSSQFNHFRGKPCGIRNCEITYNKSRIGESDAVLFHCRDLPSADKMAKIPRHARQRWVFFTHENPVFTYKNLTDYNHVFNWTMTYRTDSDFFVPYNYYSRLEPEDRRLQREDRRLEHEGLKPEDYQLKPEEVSTSQNYAKGKDQLVAWLVGNCGQLRDKVVAKLSNYINVTIFGACANKFNQSGNHCTRGSRDCNKLLQRFKFYLSFENQMCLDYVTEKYWYTPFEHDMVPVVLGSNYGSDVVIPGSFINVLDFPSIQSLAKYLQYLDRNDTAYNEYFNWKTKYKVDYPMSVVWTCNLCAALNNASIPSKIYHHLDSFWGTRTTCGRNLDKINAMLKDN